MEDTPFFYNIHTEQRKLKELKNFCKVPACYLLLIIMVYKKNASQKNSLKVDMAFM